MSALDVQVDNGAIVEIKVGTYAGRAGMRRRGESMEIAYMGFKPAKMPIGIDVDGVPMIAVERIMSAAKGFVVLIVEPLDG